MKSIRDALTIIGAQDDGITAGILSDKIAETAKAVREAAHGRKGAKAKGKVTLTLDFTHDGNGVTITAEVTAKAPKPANGSSFYWVMEDGSLSTEHPQQTNLFGGPRVVEHATA